MGGDVPTAKELLLLGQMKTGDKSIMLWKIRLKLRGHLWITLWITCGYLGYNLSTWSLLPSFAEESTSKGRESIADLQLFTPSLLATTSVQESQLTKINMFKIERLMYAMAEFEGWKDVISDPAGMGSRSYRHNNPGNLRSSPFEIGNKGNFAVFNTTADGFAALKWDLVQKCKGKTVTGLNGQSTLRDLIYKWAPPSDKNTPELYLNAVIKMTGFTADTKLEYFLK